jgi:hypothetical protein
VVVEMEGIQHVTEYSKGFIQYHLNPMTTGHLLFIMIYTIFSIYFYDFLFRFPLLKWIYLGCVVIFIGTIYGDGRPPIAPPPNFKLGTL